MAASISHQYDHVSATAIRCSLGLMGVIGMVSGLFIITWPERTDVVVGAVLAAYAGATGLINLMMGIFASRMRISSRVGYAVLGAAFVAASVVAFINLGPFTQSVGPAVGIVIGTVWIANGVIMVLILNDASVRISTLLHGLLNVVAGAMLIAAPFWQEALWLPIGAALVALGMLQEWRAWRFARPPMTAVKAEPVTNVVAQ